MGGGLGVFIPVGGGYRKGCAPPMTVRGIPLSGAFQSNAFQIRKTTGGGGGYVWCVEGICSVCVCVCGLVDYHVWSGCKPIPRFLQCYVIVL